MGAPFVWYDVTATPGHADAVREFYDVARLDHRSRHQPRPLQRLDHGGRPALGLGDRSLRRPPGWIPYVRVDDLDVSVDKATSLGATVVAGKAEGPAGTAVTIADPAGAVLSPSGPRSPTRPDHQAQAATGAGLAATPGRPDRPRAATSSGFFGLAAFGGIAATWSSALGGPSPGVRPVPRGSEAGMVT